jgi:hypothetical protein
LCCRKVVNYSVLKGDDKCRSKSVSAAVLAAKLSCAFNNSAIGGIAIDGAVPPPLRVTQRLFV